MIGAAETQEERRRFRLFLVASAGNGTAWGWRGFEPLVIVDCGPTAFPWGAVGLVVAVVGVVAALWWR